MIVLNDIHKHYGRVRANDGISLALEPGRIYAFVGENGAGKSTLMRILSGHTRPTAGRIEIAGETNNYLTPLLARQHGIGMLYQDPLDFPAMPIWENFQLGSHRRSKAEVTAAIDHLSARLAVGFQLDETVSSLTVGERQLLELLRLLDLGATTLILDEPTTGITPEQKRDLFAMLAKLAREDHHTIILVTHKLAEAFELADTIFIMRHGRLISTLQPPYNETELVQLMFGTTTETVAEQLPEPPSPTTPRLELHDTHFAGPRDSMGPINFAANPGECVGLVGLDGSGQELFLRGLCGLDRMPAGSICLDGQNYNRNDFKIMRQAGVQFVPADRLEMALFPRLNLMEHISLVFPNRSGDRDNFYKSQCVDRFNLHAHPATQANELSGGNQQRLLLSLIPDTAQLLLMEHPTRGLDAESARQVWDHFKGRCLNGATLIFFSPDLDEVLEHSQRVIVFYNRAIAAVLEGDAISMEVVGALMAGKELDEILAAQS